MSDFSSSLIIFDNLQFATDEAEAEYYFLAAADRAITAPKLCVSHGKGVFNSALAAERNAYCAYALNNTVLPRKRYISVLPIVISYRLNAQRHMEYLMSRKVNPRTEDEAKVTVVSCLRLSMLAKPALGWEDESNAELYDDLTRKQRLGFHRARMAQLSFL